MGFKVRYHGKGTGWICCFEKSRSYLYLRAGGL